MAQGVPYWDYDWEVWDRLILDGDVLPGIWDVESGNVKRVLDVKKAPGRDGAIVKDMGYENGALVLIGQIGDQLEGPREWAELQTIIASLRMTQKGKDRKPVTISHPKALHLGITQVNITEIDVPRIDNGILTQSIRVLEYIPKPKGTGAKKTNASLEAELRRSFTGDFAGTNSISAAARLSEVEKKNIADANREFRLAEEQGKVPVFKATKPQYSPALVD